MAPPSQLARVRPISFRLEGGEGDVRKHTLVIRPEELTKNNPALQSPYQTFDGAFLDDFGPGLTTIQISGHTGWGAGPRPDGEAAFKELHATVWTEWHRARLRAVQAGRDPATVKLIFVDQLNNFTGVVAPGSFTLKRSRSRPLLSMFAISMTVIAEDITDAVKDPLSFKLDASPTTVLAGLKSLNSTIAAIEAKAANVRGFIDATIASPVQGLMNLSTSAMSGVVGLVDNVRGVVGAEASQMAGIAADLSAVGRNVFNTYNAVANLPDFIAHEVSGVASLYENAFCILRNAFTKVQEYPDYDGLYGASSCSSTVGGSPPSIYAGVNAWEYVLPGTVSLASVSPEARSNIDFMKATDPVLRPLGLTELAARTASIIGGVGIL